MVRKQKLNRTVWITGFRRNIFQLKGKVLWQQSAVDTCQCHYLDSGQTTSIIISHPTLLIAATPSQNLSASFQTRIQIWCFQCWKQELPGGERGRAISAFTTRLFLPLLFLLVSMKLQSLECVQKVCLGKWCSVTMGNLLEVQHLAKHKGKLTKLNQFHLICQTDS